VLPGTAPADRPSAPSAAPSSGPTTGAPAGASQSPGALHVHSVFSFDGHGEIESIAAAARATGLEWIGMTDHDSLGARYAGFEGRREGVHVIVGYEWTPRGGDHALMYGRPEAIPAPLARTVAPDEALRIVTAHGGMAFVAHPDEQRAALAHLPPLPWHDWSVRGFTGIELWNYMSEWAERLTRLNAVHHAIWPGMRMRGPTARSLAWWDALNRLAPAGGLHGGARLTVGVSGVDAHGEGIRVLGRHWTVFPYERVFRTYTNVLLLDAPLPADAGAAREAILRAIGEGRLLFADRTRGDPLGASFEVRAPSARLGVGGMGRLADGAQAEVRLEVPEAATLRILRDGEVVASGQGRELMMAAGAPGAYRAEAERGGRPWLFTNPIVLLP
jgi:hypothetical protein